VNRSSSVRKRRRRSVHSSRRRSTRRTRRPSAGASVGTGRSDAEAIVAAMEAQDAVRGGAFVRGLQRGGIGFRGLSRNIFREIKRTGTKKSAVGTLAEDETAAGRKLLEKIGSRT